MKKVLCSTFCLWFASLIYAQDVTNYKSLDTKQPITFKGSYIVYDQDTITLGTKAFFIDGQLTDEEAAQHPFVFNTLTKAVANLRDGSEDTPMVLYIAPYVYWVDDPDDPAIRVAKDGGTPYGMIINCEWLKFHGLNNDAKNVVLASNRGQTIGAQGNFTMFKFVGQGTSSENVTFGNYCSVDLEYPLLPKLSRKKRAAAIVQAQLIHCNGDKIVARNTRFISRLNLCPFVGGKRVLFDQCHFESTDDALCGTGVYLNSTLDFYGSKPFYSTSGTGAVFLNCDIRSFTGARQFFTKANGQVAVVDTRITSAANPYVGWNEVVPAETKNYQYRVALNKSPVLISKSNLHATVNMSGKNILNAYRFIYKDKVIYNTYNLLSGNDDWDPMNIKQLVHAKEQQENTAYTMLPVQLIICPTKVAIETGKNDVTLVAKINRFGNYAVNVKEITWSVAPQFKNLVALDVSADGLSCKVIPKNNYDDTRQVIVSAKTPSGLEAASVVNVVPTILEAPELVAKPQITIANGSLQLNYKINETYNDESNVIWYRCSNAKGENAIEVAVSRLQMPLKNYSLSPGDEGYYMMASITPKHIRSKSGEAVQVIMTKAISKDDIKSDNHFLTTDFKNVSTKNQPKVLPGFFTWEHFEPAGNEARYTTNKNADAWYYGEGVDGAANMKGLLQGRSAAMRYTPVGKTFGDMKLTMTLAPFKTAGQGFSVAHLYMDVLIKLDTKTMTGYALRFIRTTKNHDALDVLLVKYENGNVQAITEPATTSIFKPICSIDLEVNNNKLKATITSTSPAQQTKGLQKPVAIETAIAPNNFGGFGIQYNGGSPTLIKHVKLEWK